MLSPGQPGVSVIDTLIAGDSYEMETAVPMFVGFIEHPSSAMSYEISSYQEFEEKCGKPDPAGYSILAYVVRHYFDNKGGRCWILSLGNYQQMPNATPDKLAERAVTVLDAKTPSEDITLLSVPDCRAMIGATTASWIGMWAAMLRFRADRHDIFCLFDVPSSLAGAKACLEAFSNQRAAFGAVYWPHLITDYRAPDGERIVLPPSAAVAAAIGVTDHERGIWKAPANVPLSHVVQPQYGHIAGEALFDEAGPSVNLIRSFPGRGVRIWGARTLEKQAASPWRYVQTRRLASYIQQQLCEQCRFAVFEPNNELTWVKAKGLVRAWLRKLWKRGALFGATEDEAFQLFLGLGESMTVDDINAGRMIFRIQLALQYPAEFVELRLQFNTRESDAVQLDATHQNRSKVA